jgi:hypothetical protein
MPALSGNVCSREGIPVHDPISKLRSFSGSSARFLARAAVPLALLIAAIPLALDGPDAVAQEGPALIVDDAATANPELVDVDVGDPYGFGISGQTLQAPPGFRVDVVGAGLGDPRFMAFDSAGNLLVGAAGDGVVYRYPFADGLLGEPEPLVTGLQRPASVALFVADEGEYLYVGEPGQVTRFRYDRQVRSEIRKWSCQICQLADTPRGRLPSGPMGCSTWRSALPAISASRRSRYGRRFPA